MVISTVVLAEILSHYQESVVAFVGLLGTYALTYIIYTK